MKAHKSSKTQKPRSCPSMARTVSVSDIEEYRESCNAVIRLLASFSSTQPTILLVIILHLFRNYPGKAKKKFLSELMAYVPNHTLPRSRCSTKESTSSHRLSGHPY